MRFIGSLAFTTIAVASAFGCSSAKSSSAGSGAGATADPLTFVMKATVPPSSESHKCQYVTLPPDGGFIVSGTHDYTPGSHHLLLYRTDLATIPAGQEGLRDCYEAGGTMMSHIRGVVYAAQTPTGSFTMPDGVGLPYQPNEVLLFQSHYLNAGAASVDAEVDVHLVGATQAIQQRAGFLFYYDPFIHVPVGGKSRASMRCKVRQDITLINAGSHYHKRGVDYAAYLDPPTGAPAEAPFYTSSDWDHPASLAATMSIAAGSHIRFGCGYDNTGGPKEYFQGQSAEDNEMCMFVGLYYPDMGQADDFCLEPDTFGTGTAACSAASACIQACPASAMPTGADSGDMDPCWQKCFVDSCPSASAPLTAQLRCIGKNCQTECAAGGTACATCAFSKCPDQVNACQLHKCAGP